MLKHFKRKCGSSIQSERWVVTFLVRFLAIFHPNCLTFFLYHPMQNFRARYVCPSFFCVSRRNLCRINIFDGSGEWHCVRCVASTILKSDSPIFVFVACL